MIDLGYNYRITDIQCALGISQLKKFGGNISKTAKFVGMERSALHRKMKTLSIVSENKISKKE